MEKPGKIDIKSFNFDLQAKMQKTFEQNREVFGQYNRKLELIQKNIDAIIDTVKDFNQDKILNKDLLAEYTAKSSFILDESLKVIDEIYDNPIMKELNKINEELSKNLWDTTLTPNSMQDAGDPPFFASEKSKAAWEQCKERAKKAPADQQLVLDLKKLYVDLSKEAAEKFQEQANNFLEEIYAQAGAVKNNIVLSKHILAELVADLSATKLKNLETNLKQLKHNIVQYQESWLIYYLLQIVTLTWYGRYQQKKLASVENLLKEIQNLEEKYNLAENQQIENKRTLEVKNLDQSISKIYDFTKHKNIKNPATSEAFEKQVNKIEKEAKKTGVVITNIIKQVNQEQEEKKSIFEKKKT